MTVFAGFDVHRAQITFDALDTKTGEVTRGRIDSSPRAVEGWVAMVLDVFRPASAPGALPTVMWVHGGGFRGGSKEELSSYFKLLASHGYTVVVELFSGVVSRVLGAFSGLPGGTRLPAMSCWAACCACGLLSWLCAYRLFR